MIEPTNMASRKSEEYERTMTHNNRRHIIGKATNIYSFLGEKLAVFTILKIYSHFLRHVREVPYFKLAFIFWGMSFLICCYSKSR